MFRAIALAAIVAALVVPGLVFAASDSTTVGGGTLTVNDPFRLDLWGGGTVMAATASVVCDPGHVVTKIRLFMFKYPEGDYFDQTTVSDDTFVNPCGQTYAVQTDPCTNPNNNNKWEYSFYGRIYYIPPGEVEQYGSAESWVPVKVGWRCPAV